jgi:hypothetical protein
MFVHFLKKKLKVLIFVKDSIISLHDANYWSVIVMNTNQLLHYDLLIKHNYFPSRWVRQFVKSVRHFLERMAIHNAFTE